MSEGLCIPHFYTLLHLSAQFSGLGCAKMYILHPWSEWVEKEAKPGQFFRGSPWSKLLSQAYVSLALTFGVNVWRLPNAFSDSSAPTEGSSGPYRVDFRENCWVVIIYRSSDSHPEHDVFDPFSPDEEIMHRAFDSSHLFSNSSVILLDRSFSSSDACLTDN